MASMRMRGMVAPKVQPKGEAHEPVKSRKTKVDPATGLALIDRGWYDEIVPPKTPKSYPKEPKTLEELIQHHHYFVARDWNNPNSEPVHRVASKTITEAHRLGFKGHIVQWCNNLLAGELRHGKVDFTPKKLQLKLREPIPS